MNLGKRVRLNRIFSHASGRLCSVAVDHWVGYQMGLPKGLVDMPRALSAIMTGLPDAITMMKGAALTCWAPYAGRVPLILQAGCFTASDSIIEVMTNAEEVVRLGADAMAVSIGVRGVNEGKFLRILNDKVTEAAKYDLPVIAHIYPRDFTKEPRILHDPDSIAWAVRCGIECGVDVIKVGFTGDVASYRQIVQSCPVPVVAAGGPKCDTLEQALEMMQQVVQSGARGATIGRNVWGHGNIPAALKAFKAVIHDERAPREALKFAGLS